MNIGEKIKKVRKKKRLSQKELGEKLGVSQAMIAQYETGRRNPKKETLQKIADVLDIDIIQLIPELLEKQMIEKEVVDNEELFKRLSFYFQKLNHEGKQRAIEQICTLSKIIEYKNE